MIYEREYSCIILYMIVKDVKFYIALEKRLVAEPRGVIFNLPT